MTYQQARDIALREHRPIDWDALTAAAAGATFTPAELIDEARRAVERRTWEILLAELEVIT